MTMQSIPAGDLKRIIRNLSDSMYDNLTLTKKVRKGRLKSPLNVLMGGEDDTIFYKAALTFVFCEFESFVVIKDLKIPQKDEKNGVVIVFDDGRISYFKRQSNQLTDTEYESILEVCCFLKDTYGGSIEAYVLCSPEVEIMPYDGIERDGIALILASLADCDGDAAVEMLENKRRNGQRFTFQDHVCHLLLPFMGHRDRDEFMPKYQHCMIRP